MEKWRENCGQWYRDRLRSVRQRLEEKKAEYNKLMDAPAGEHAEDLERTTTLLNRIREVYANG